MHSEPTTATEHALDWRSPDRMTQLLPCRCGVRMHARAHVRHLHGRPEERLTFRFYVQFSRYTIYANRRRIFQAGS